MTYDEVQDFEVMVRKLQSLYEEMQALSKKSPNDLINSFKLRFVNSALTTANEFLGDAGRPFPDFDLFDDEALPSNSDVVMILAQYLRLLDLVRDENIVQYQGLWYWVIDEERSPERTAPPSWLKK